MLEDLKRSEANRQSHVCPEQPLAHLFTKNEPTVTINVLPPDYKAMSSREPDQDSLQKTLLKMRLNAEFGKPKGSDAPEGMPLNHASYKG